VTFLACGPALAHGRLADISVYDRAEGRWLQVYRHEGRAYVVGQNSLAANARANLIGEAVGFVKLLADADTGEILGVHCIGPHASELVHTGRAVMFHGGNVRWFAEAVFNYPTLGEAYKHAAYDALDRMRERKEKVRPIERAAGQAKG
jgi:NAD(P) transhydrogenase